MKNVLSPERDMIEFRDGDYYVRIVADSTAVMPHPHVPHHMRLTTMEVCFPRFILAEFNTHRDKSRNSASSRAIPVPRRIEQVLTRPFVPEAFAENKRGMQAGDALPETFQLIARTAWLGAMRACVAFAEILVALDIHKQWANRVIELWAWHTVVVTATRWENFFNLRTHKAAQPEMQIIAKLMKQAYEASVPRELGEGQWHLPYVSDDERMEYEQDPMMGIMDLVATSIVRCAAVSYERQYAERTIEQVTERFNESKRNGHWSPFEHAAKVASADEIDSFALWRLVPPPTDGVMFEPVCIGNFDVPWLQFRKTVPGEDVWHAPAEAA